MFVTTHAIIASTIAVKTGNPLIYIPAALLNHFVFDVFPHFGLSREEYGVRGWKKILSRLVVFDAICGTLTFFYILRVSGFSFGELFLVNLLAGWPDLLGLYQNFFNPNFWPQFKGFHDGIQRESVWGIVIELLVISFCFWLIYT